MAWRNREMSWPKREMAWPKREMAWPKREMARRAEFPVRSGQQKNSRRGRG